MDLQKAILRNYSLSMLLFLAYLFYYCGATRDNHTDKSGSFQRVNFTGDSKSLSQRRHYRYVASECRNDTTFTIGLDNSCYYDRDCFKIFSDCCYDYEARCGRQESTEPKSVSLWKCVNWRVHPTCTISGVTGVWMIYKCPADWPSTELRTKCENASSELSYPIEDFTPVVGGDNLTYRNKHCALCNGIESYTSWNIDVVTLVLPPEELDLNSRLRFIDNNGGTFFVVLGEKQPRRYCYGENYIDNCSSTDHPAYKDCINGPVELVTKTTKKYFKNTACAECNGYPGLFHSGRSGACGRVFPEGFSVVFNLRSTDIEPTTTLVKVSCPSGTVYDTSLKFCREGYIVSARSGKLATEFLILLWFKLSRVRDEMNSSLVNNFKSALASQFSLVVSQMSKIVFHKQDKRIDLIVATFRVTLTPFQSLIMANQHKPNNVTRENTAFLKLLNFTGNFTLAVKEYSVSVIKIISKRLSCYKGITFQSNEYKLDMENGTLAENKTGKIFSLDNYTLVGEEGGNMTVCRRLVLSDCPNGAYVPLRSNEYVIFPNLSIYQNETERIFNFGEYLIDESLSKDNSHSSNATQNTLSARNAKIFVCLPFKDTFIKAVTKQRKRTTSYGLRILTLIGFSISMMCLLLLLITYGLFKELRTLPGMNLMSLSFSMLLSHFLCLISANFSTTTACKVFAVLGHYIFLVSFLAMSVISFHSCRAFSQPLTRSGANKPWKRFVRYSVFAWLVPAIYIAVCVTLDETKAFLVDYGRRNCWLGTANAKLYLFLLPIAIVLLYNIYTFIKTAVSLSRHEKQRKTLQRQEGKQNLLICTKLATLVGFPWLFSFFGVLFPEVEAFEYLFVVFVCLQGLYIGMAFLFNKKTLKLYKDRLNIDSNESSSYRSAPTFEMTVPD